MYKPRMYVQRVNPKPERVVAALEVNLEKLKCSLFTIFPSTFTTSTKRE